MPLAAGESANTSSVPRLRDSRGAPIWFSIKDKLSQDQTEGPDQPDIAAEGDAPFELTVEDVPAEETDANAHLLEVLREVIDPELGINIVDIGLVYALRVDDETIEVAVTATTPACPMSGAILRDVEGALQEADGQGRAVEVYLVWEPAWDPDFMSEAAEERLGW